MSLVKTDYFLMVNLYFQGMQKTKLDQTKVHGLYDHVGVFRIPKILRILQYTLVWRSSIHFNILDIQIPPEKVF